MRKRNHKVLSLLLAAEMLAGSLLAVVPAQAAATPLAGTPYKANGSYDVNVSHVFINQVYGGGAGYETDEGGNTNVSNGFIELYNPTDGDVSLEGWSLQYADRASKAGSANKKDVYIGPTDPWVMFPLSGTIKAHSSYLVVGNPTNDPTKPAVATKLNISGKGDLSIERHIINKGLKIALVSNQTTLTDVNPFINKPAGYVDMLGTGSNDKDSDINGYETAYPTGSDQGTSKKKAIRRQTLTDSDNNKTDFKQVDYDAANPTDISINRPRSGADGKWDSKVTVVTEAIADAYIGLPYSAAVTTTGGQPPYTYSATGLPAGLSINSAGVIAGTPAAGAEGAKSVTVSVYDSVYSATNPLPWASKTLPLNVLAGAVPDKMSVSKIGEYSVGQTNADGGVAEIVKYNKDNGKFYVVNGSGNPPTLDIATLTVGGSISKDKSVAVKDLSETGGFVYGDLTSVDINTATKRVFVSLQEKDSMKNGKILMLNYDGALLKSYEAGVQPDMIKSTPDGRYVLTADEGEPREQGKDPEGSVTIVDTTTDTVTRVKFNDPSVIDDKVHIRGASDPVTGMINGSGTKADAIRDLEPEYITLSADNTKAYVSLQENNAVAVIDIAAKKVTAVKGLGFKDLNDPKNALDLVNDGKIKLENVPFNGMYMPDGIASYTLNGKTYLFTGNEGDVTDWPGRKNGSTIKDMKSKLEPSSAAAKFLSDPANTSKYDKVEVASDMDKNSIYMYGGRSFSVWNADTMEQVFDSGNAFEEITSQRLPKYFNASNSNATLDSRSTKKGPEPEDIKIGAVGEKVFAFVGLERIGGIMTYDVTDPVHPVFFNYINTRNFTNILSDAAPEGIEFIPATVSPTGLPLLLVANEVGGTVAILQLNVTKVTLDKTSLSLEAGAAPVKLNATVAPVGGTAATVTWKSSNASVASVDANGTVTPIAAGTAVLTATSADGYGVAEASVKVLPAGSGESWTLTVMHTNDTHAHLADAARRATLVKQVRTESKNSILLDAGDVFSGDLYFTKWLGKADLGFMNDMGYDAMTFGNHEFDQGTAVLANFVKDANFPLVSSNIDFSKDANIQPLLKSSVTLNTYGKGGMRTTASAGVYPYVILDAGDGHKVGVFGLTTEDTKETSSPGKDVVFNAASASAQLTVKELEKEGIHTIIALSHLGYARDKDLAIAVEGIDLIVGGHTHTKLDAPEIVTDSVHQTPTVIVQANEWGKFLGRVEITFDSHGNVITSPDFTKGKLEPVTAAVVEDAAAKVKLASYNAELDVLKNQIVGKTTVMLDGERANVRSKETNLGNFIADGMLSKGKELKGAQIAIQNGGGIRASIPEGDITMGEVRTVIPFGNTLYILDVTGQQLLDGLENGVSGATLADLPGKFPQVAGMKFKWDPSQPAGSRVFDVQIKKDMSYEPLSLTATYRIATNSFMANGGDGYVSFAQAVTNGAYHEDLGYPDYENFINYLSLLGGTVTPAVEGRIETKTKPTGSTTSNNHRPSSSYVPSTPTTVTDSGVAIKPELVKTEDGRIQASVTVKMDDIRKALELSQDKIIIRIESGDAASVVAQIPGEALLAIADKNRNATLVIASSTGSYALPVGSLDLAALSAKLKTTSDKLEIRITMTTANDLQSSELSGKASAIGAKPLVKAVDFAVSVTGNGQAETVTNFGSTFVNRTIHIEATNLKPEQTTGVMLAPTGELRFVPSVFTLTDGKWVATLKRNGNSLYTVVEHRQSFQDTAAHWAKADVELLASKLIVQGISENQFQPDSNITRAQFTAIIVRSLGLDDSKAVGFNDISDKDWFKGVVAAAYDAKLLTGYEDGTFRPNQPITREELAVLMNNALRYAKLSNGSQQTDQALSLFKDSGSIAGWAKDSVAAIVQAGIANGKSEGNYEGKAQATRAEASVMVKRLLQKAEFIN
ncbi:multifunctional 2',3'-cyclic-nucleotide 2'-phosphodiesterase/5'-nucleotidase/3'-nucleotidase [Paenibacillus sp. LMG 31456]|uniref:Multifunctional 2',3'-cyclic-nucleotide 2'-phosphodiesterase/5'-nucleotidase/3'-nucleotidase n=1 Tax=Paenibacillus foliorum TaxID=2654974 RepID=A0A972JXU7_9BACL|nr:choice-of-anchor I family protein [Paenibacillus foliorum]NOU91866.1 multifunctional 2',3'-cyclic-nucleotide 2'-phosphodiesterase/5'-nucleotidase/3'-nucleotidase [Paenibacillus foliorum]